MSPSFFRPRNTPRAKALRRCATPAERLLWSQLRKSSIGYKFSRQMPIGPYFADLHCREAKLVVELDGFSHDHRVDSDLKRDAFLNDNGYRVLRFSNQQVLDNLEGVVTRIKAVLVGWPIPSPSRARGGNTE